MKLRRWLMIGAAVGAVYFAVFGGDYSLFEVRRLEQQTAREGEALEVARAELDALRARADSLESDNATIERLAREQFGMIRSGERLYRFAEVPDSASAETRESDGSEADTR